MFGFRLIKTSRLKELQNIEAKWYIAQSHTWWPYQAFVCRLLRRVVNGEHDMWQIRLQFDEALHEYVKNGGKESDEERSKIAAEL